MEGKLHSACSWNAGRGGLERFSRGGGWTGTKDKTKTNFFQNERGRDKRVASKSGNGMFYCLDLFLFVASALIPCLTLSVPGCFAFYMSHNPSSMSCRRRPY